MIDFIAEWCAWSGEARELVEACMERAAALLAGEWIRHFRGRTLSAQGVSEFYRSSQARGYDLLANARRTQEQAWVEECAERLEGCGCRSVLDFGCGMGAFGFGLADRDFAVMLAEVSLRHYGLLQVLVKRFSNAAVLHPDSLPDDSAFDAIVCLEVMEHVWDPRRTTAMLMRHLKPGGIFFASWSFPEDTQDNPLHLRGEFTVEGYQQFLESEYGLEWLNPGPCWARVLRKP